MTPADARRLARALPQAQDDSSDAALAFSVGGKGFAWTYNARREAGGPRVPHLEVLAVRCRREMKPVLLEALPDALFDDDHYRNFPAVLVRLEAVDEDQLLGLLEGGWRCQAPKTLVKAFETGSRPTSSRSGDQ